MANKDHIPHQFYRNYLKSNDGNFKGSIIEGTLEIWFDLMKNDGCLRNFVNRVVDEMQKKLLQQTLGLIGYIT